VLRCGVLLAHYGDQRDVQAAALAHHGQDRELDSDAPWQAARPHLEALVGVAPLDGPADGVVPDVHDAVPADKDAVKEGHELQEGIKDQPLDERSRQGDDYEADAQADEHPVG